MIVVKYGRRGEYGEGGQIAGTKSRNHGSVSRSNPQTGEGAAQHGSYSH